MLTFLLWFLCFIRISTMKRNHQLTKVFTIKWQIYSIILGHRQTHQQSTQRVVYVILTTRGMWARLQRHLANVLEIMNAEKHGYIQSIKRHKSHLRCWLLMRRLQAFLMSLSTFFNSLSFSTILSTDEPTCTHQHSVSVRLWAKAKVKVSYSSPSVGPRADPGVQAVSSQVTFYPWR